MVVEVKEWKIWNRWNYDEGICYSKIFRYSKCWHDLRQDGGWYLAEMNWRFSSAKFKWFRKYESIVVWIKHRDRDENAE